MLLGINMSWENLTGSKLDFSKYLNSLHAIELPFIYSDIQDQSFPNVPFDKKLYNKFNDEFIGGSETIMAGETLYHISSNEEFKSK